ncbi:MAG: hypothetical protein JXM70_16450 [Pirellulales bacterium]|nr:hypothetical protein [Pirellulales bacterium]
MAKVIGYCTTRYDKKLGKIEHYQRYPQMMPFVGEDYDGKTHFKVLLIAESHYFPSCSSKHKDTNAWYDGYTDLSDTEKSWINNRGGIKSGKDQHWKSKGHAIYRNIEKAMIEAGFPKRENMFSYVAYMNCFQRPAMKGDSIRNVMEDLDKEKSKQVLEGVVHAIKPDYICFVSSFAWHTIGKHMEFNGLKEDPMHTPHPACCWWHRKSKKGKGKIVFKKFMRGTLLNHKPKSR